ncbi:hypothetical protein [Colwellia piezophila]|uniref:hypothetical protein n=1 Tax=Colwellia piezophila TaxID=211668 RepID=UPI00035FF1F9|nr:hypothetical protein [Colwellia piezophila]
MILEYLKTSSLFILLGGLVRYLCSSIDSNYLINFLDENLISLLIALLAINTTTGSILMTKLHDILKQHGGDFQSTLSQLKLSIIEQLSFIIIALIALVLLDSKQIVESYFFAKLILESTLIAVFIASLHNLYDTASSIFIILSWEGEQ